MARAGALTLVVAVVAVGCLYDEDGPCGQRAERVGAFCRCVDGFGLSDVTGQCEPCDPETEETVDGKCACAEGLGRRLTTGRCEPAPEALGEPCDPSDAPCTDAEFDACELNSLGEGYCTNAPCSSSRDCFGDYACEGTGPTAFCKAPPTGLLEPCERTADCDGFEASHCETNQGFVCLVRDCTLEPNDCHEGWECCDFSSVVSLGLPPTMCVPSGECPF